MERIKEIENDKRDCFVSVHKENAIAQADNVQKRIDNGEALSALAGIPVAVDDNILIKDQLTTAGSKMLYNFKPPFGATVVDKIIESDMIILGKTNVSEFGIGYSANNSFKGITNNPLDETKPSSGGVACVASGLANFAFSSDANGSIRHNAAQSGVCFIKPTYGTVSRFGLVANVSSMEGIGVVCQNIEDGFAALSKIAGYDEKDGTLYPAEKYEYGSDQNDLKSIKIGIPDDYLRCVNTDNLAYINEFSKKLESLGATVDKFEFPLAEVVPQVSYIISSAESSNNISRFDGVKFGYRTNNFRGINDLLVNSRSGSFGFETKMMALMGAYVLSTEHYEDYYLKVLRIRRLIKEKLEESFAKYDCILLPTCGDSLTEDESLNNSFTNAYNNSKFTALANLAGIPAISMPCAADKNNMPVGVQIMAKAFDEYKLLNIGKYCQSAKLF